MYTSLVHLIQEATHLSAQSSETVALILISICAILVFPSALSLLIAFTMAIGMFFGRR